METWPEWLRPPPDGRFADDLDRLPGLPAHTQLIDGSLVLASPQKLFHSLTLRLLEQSLARQVPAGRYRVRREMSVKIGAR